MPALSRRTFLGGSLGVAGGLLVGSQAGCSAPSGPATSGGGTATSRVTYQLSWTHSVQFGGTYQALDQGLFAKQGLDVTLAPGGPNVAADANTVSGAALLNISAGDGVARSNAQGAGLVIIGRQYQKSPNTILSLGSAPLLEPKDLVGKRIAVAGTDTPALDAFLSINKLTKRQVEFVPSQYDPAVLTAGQADGIFCFYNDLPVALRTRGIEGHSMLLADFGYDPMSQTYTVRRASLEDQTKRAQIVSLFRGDAQGWQIYKKDPAAAAALTVRKYPDAGLDLKTQEAQANVQLDLMYSAATDRHGFGWYTDADVAQNIELFGLLGIPGVNASLWDHSVLDEVYAAGPTA